MKIITRYDPPPITTREFDWVAVEDDYDLGRPVGSDPLISRTLRRHQFVG
jgi:hypothetical protein